MTRIETESKLTGVATASLLAITTMLGFVLLNGQADAALLDYKFTVTQPLQSLSETFGGPTNPIIFDFVVDSNAPNLSPPDGLYPFGEGYGGYASVTVGNTTIVLGGGVVQVAGNQNGQVFNASANGNVTGGQIGGRSLIGSHMSLYDPTGKSFTGTDLPTSLPLFEIAYFDFYFYSGSA